MPHAPHEAPTPTPQPHPPKSRFAFLTSLAYFAVALAYPALLLAHLWPPDLTNTSPAYVLISFIAFLILTFHVHAGLALLPIALLAAATRRRRLLLATIPLLLITLAPAIYTYRPRPSPAVPQNSADTLTIMSANLLYSRADAAALAQQIAAHDPDVILFQEYSARDRTRLADTLDPIYPHRTTVERDGAFGQAIYSKRPFLAPPRLYLPGPLWTEPQISVQLALAGKPITITNIHLLPPVSLDHITTHRLQAANLADLAADHIARADSLILAGDFNAPPRSHHYRAMERAGLRESHHLAGRARGTTWPRTGALAYVPGIRLDHIFISPDLLCLHAQTAADTGSDHRPIIARLTRRPPREPSAQPPNP